MYTRHRIEDLTKQKICVRFSVLLKNRQSRCNIVYTMLPLDCLFLSSFSFLCWIFCFVCLRPVSCVHNLPLDCLFLSSFSFLCWIFCFCLSSSCVLCTQCCPLIVRILELLQFSVLDFLFCLSSSCVLCTQCCPLIVYS